MFAGLAHMHWGDFLLGLSFGWATLSVLWLWIAESAMREREQHWRFMMENERLWAARRMYEFLRDRGINWRKPQ